MSQELDDGDEWELRRCCFVPQTSFAFYDKLLFDFYERTYYGNREVIVKIIKGRRRRLSIFEFSWV